MVRRYFRRRYANKDKYSIEQTNFQSSAVQDWTEVQPASQFTQTSYQFITALVPPSTTQGMRKIKHLTISMANITGDQNGLIWYAIVYVPEGYEPQALQIPNVGAACVNYAANQFIMNSGVIDFSAGPTRIRSKLSRNLNSGDQIYLILATTAESPATMKVYGQVSYAITLQ